MTASPSASSRTVRPPQKAKFLINRAPKTSADDIDLSFVDTVWTQEDNRRAGDS
jgi:hypothetical protein